MKRSILKFLPFLVGSVLGLSSCGGDSDDDNPSDEVSPVIVTPTSPSEDQTFGLGGDFTYTGDFTDNVALKQVVFSVSSLKGTDGEEWAPESVTIELDGTEDSVDENIFGTIPSDAYNGSEGYELNIQCEDEAGNTATTQVMFFLE